MTSKNNNNSSDKIKRVVEDNGPKWGSYVKQNADQSFPYDAKMASERPAEWLKMINERTSWLNRNSKYDYTTGKIYPRSVPKNKQNPIPFDSSPFTHLKKSNPSPSPSPSPSGSGSGSGSGSFNSKPSSSNSSKSSGGYNSKYANNSKK